MLGLRLSEALRIQVCWRISLFRNLQTTSRYPGSRRNIRSTFVIIRLIAATNHGVETSVPTNDLSATALSSLDILKIKIDRLFLSDRIKFYFIEI